VVLGEEEAPREVEFGVMVPLVSPLLVLVALETDTVLPPAPGPLVVVVPG